MKGIKKGHTIELEIAKTAFGGHGIARLDGLVVASPTPTHVPLTRAALKAGKHVLVEKPLTATTEEARSLIDEAAALDKAYVTVAELP